MRFFKFATRLARRHTHAVLRLGLLIQLLGFGICARTIFADTAPSVIGSTVEFPHVLRTAIGVTRGGTSIDVFLQEDDVDLRIEKTRILLIGGLNGDRRSVDAVLEALRWFHGDAPLALRKRFTLSAIPCANPATLQATVDSEKFDLSLGYPPVGKAYHDVEQQDEVGYLWRWLGMHAPDMVIDLRIGSNEGWQIPATLPINVDGQLPTAETFSTAGDLIVELGRHDVCQTGRIPAIRLRTQASALTKQIESFLSRFAVDDGVRSPARIALQERLDRTPLVVARQLAKYYGHDLNQVVYIPAIAVMGRLRLGTLDDDPAHLQDVRQIVKPYFDGAKSSKPSSGSGLSGHLVFAELAEHTRGMERDRFIELARIAADLGFDESGNTKPIMPFHHEMSDAAFMGGPILASVGRLTQDDRYFDACATHMQSVRELVLRDDGLYRHSPLDEAAWGRGNGFPALGLAMCLDDFPKRHPERMRLHDHFQRHLRALAKHQDPTGCWHQVIDRPESYRELSSTCMITYAMARGIRRGWLDKDEFAPVVDRAWGAIRTRVRADGQLVDVCTGTGKQPSLRAYYDRTAILGRDPRGGAMSLLVATEIAELESTKGQGQ